MDEKELMQNGEEQTETFTAPEEDTATETLDEMTSEEMEEVLMEQDLLDGDAETIEAEVEAEAEIDPLNAALELAVAQEVITAEQAEMTVGKMTALELMLSRTKKTVKKLAFTATCLGAALVISLGAVAALTIKSKGSEPFAGLTVGKSYTANITLPDYTKLTYKDSYKAPTEADLNEKIKDALSDAKKTTTTDVKDGLKEGDVIKLDFNGYVDGKKLDSACATDQELELGSGKFIPGFEEGLVGKKVGQDVVLNLTFPKDYSDETLQGKAIKFEVKIKSATRTTYPELTDTLVSEITEKKYTTVDAYKSGLFEEMEQSARTKADEAARNEVWTNLAGQTKLKKYPQNMYDYYVAKLDAQYKNYYSTYGATDLESFMAAQNLDLDTYVKNQIVYEFCIYTVAAKQGITIADTDFESMMSQYKCTTVEQLTEKLGVERFELEASILYGKVTDYLMEIAIAQ